MKFQKSALSHQVVHLYAHELICGGVLISEYGHVHLCARKVEYTKYRFGRSNRLIDYVLCQWLVCTHSKVCNQCAVKKKSFWYKKRKRRKLFCIRLLHAVSGWSQPLKLFD